MPMRTPVIGDWNNTYDNNTLWAIDIISDDGTIGNIVRGTEWFAELCFAGWWRINAMDKWSQENPGVPFPGPAQWLDDVVTPTWIEPRGPNDRPWSPPDPPVDPEPEDPPAEPVDEPETDPA